MPPPPLGPWGLCEASYEAIIREHLAGPDGQPLPCVTLHGKLGAEKIPILQKARVGLPNPSALTECCPGSAMEIQACGTPVVTLRKHGFLDTVAHGSSGFLCEDKFEIYHKTVELLQTPETADAMGQAGIRYIRERFAPAEIAAQWRELLVSLA